MKQRQVLDQAMDLCRKQDATITKFRAGIDQAIVLCEMYRDAAAESEDEQSRQFWGRHAEQFVALLVHGTSAVPPVPTRKVMLR